jgi:hypothetical protein
MPNAPLIRNPDTGRTVELPSAAKLGVTLGQVQNVTLTNPQNGDVVSYEAATQTFKNAPNVATAQVTPQQQFFM